MPVSKSPWCLVGKTADTVIWGLLKALFVIITAGPKTGNMPSLRIVTDGRSDLPGPLSQLCLGRDGTFYVVAAGRAFHAGKGEWQGVTNGNTNMIGIEAENNGKNDDFPWPEVQMDAYRRGVAAILKHVGQDKIMCCGHKEYALPHGRKSDPIFNMNVFRLGVAAIMDGRAQPPLMIPPVDTDGRPTLRRNATGDLVKRVQAKIGVSADGNFGAKTEAAVRVFQRNHGIVPDGIVGPQTWAALDSIAG